MQKVALGRTGLSATGTGNVEHLRENVLSLARAPLPERDRARVIELFRGVEDVSGH
jgi:hypothetical protein